MTGRYERECINALQELGFGILRAPASGSATEADRPDFVFGRPVEDHDQFLGRPASFARGVEHKSVKADNHAAYVEEAEVRALLRWCGAFGAEAYLAIRPKQSNTDKIHYFIKPEHARRTDSGKFSLPVLEAEDRASHILNVSEMTWSHRETEAVDFVVDQRADETVELDEGVFEDV